MSSELEPRASLPWLVRLRWLAVAAQVIAVAVAGFAFDAALPFAFLIALIAITAASNLALTLIARRGDPSSSPRGSTATLLGAVLVFDTLVLTLLLAATGGAMNPFTVLYLVQITLSAMVLSATWTTAIAGLSIGGFGALFLLPSDPHRLHGADNMRQHLQGMWIAFALAVGITAFFIRRVATAITTQREQIARLREANERNARLAAVTTLAAGAAHELGSPLGTIAIAAHEAQLAVAATPDAAALADDLDLIVSEVERCNDILQRMSSRLTADRDDAPSVDAHELRTQIVAALGEERARRVRFEVSTQRLPIPASAAVQSTTALIRNGIDASPGDGEIVVVLESSNATTRITVRDRGSGIAPELLGRVGEPFFTTKQPGHGLGLGVFLARAFAESHGGQLELVSEVGRGTSVVMAFPSPSSQGPA